MFRRIVRPIQAPLLAEKQIVYLSREFEQPSWVLFLGGLFAQLLPAFSIFSHSSSVAQKS
jgi:hypothetical protein